MMKLSQPGRVTSYIVKKLSVCAKHWDDAEKESKVEATVS